MLDTQKRYIWFLKNLSDWLEIHGLPAEPSKITKDDLSLWLDQNSQWSASTKHTAICAARAFFRWAVGEKKSPAKKLKHPKRHYKPQRTLERWQLEKILTNLDTSTAIGSRNTAIILLMLDTGLRSSEICRLKCQNVHICDRYLHTIVKGGDWGMAIFSEYTALHLARWVQVRPLYAARDTEEVFVGIGGAKPGTKLTRSGLRVIFRRIGERIGFHFSPHDLRRTFATMAIRGGAPTRIVQVAGRWKNIEMVERYTQTIRPEDFEPYSPVNQLMDLLSPENNSIE